LQKPGATKQQTRFHPTGKPLVTLELTVCVRSLKKGGFGPEGPQGAFKVTFPSRPENSAAKLHKAVLGRRIKYGVCLVHMGAQLELIRQVAVRTPGNACRRGKLRQSFVWARFTKGCQRCGVRVSSNPGRGKDRPAGPTGPQGKSVTRQSRQTHFMAGNPGSPPQALTPQFAARIHLHRGRGDRSRAAHRGGRRNGTKTKKNEVPGGAQMRKKPKGRAGREKREPKAGESQRNPETKRTAVEKPKGRGRETGRSRGGGGADATKGETKTKPWNKGGEIHLTEGPQSPHTRPLSGGWLMTHKRGSKKQKGNGTKGGNAGGACEISESE